MFPELKEMPKCQDGRVCNGKNNGFILRQFITEDGKKVWKFICGECLMEAQKNAVSNIDK